MLNINHKQGFTLTELIIVIVIVSILSAVVGPLIGNKFSAVSQSTQRASWVQQAEFALFHLRQDLASSVPNSLCTTTNEFCDVGDTIEFLGVKDRSRDYAARYRDKPRAGYDDLNPDEDGSFDVFSALAEKPSFVSIGVPSAIEARASWLKAISLNGPSHIAQVATVDNSLLEDGTYPITQIVLTNNEHQFLGHSPYFRAYFTDGPIGYECNNGTLYRVSNYTDFDNSTLFSTRTAAANVVKERIVDHLTRCIFQIRGGAPFQPPTLEVTLAIGQGDEAVTLNDIIVLGNGS